MAPSDYKEEKLNRSEARKQISKIMNSTRCVEFTRHSSTEAENDNLTHEDILSVLMGSSSLITEEGEFKNGSYRYRVHKGTLVVVVSFSRDGRSIIVVTVWDKRNS